ncbi:MAG: hypothetical protein ACE5I7_06600 [Candidatus Binatia bacterium]
MAVTTKKVALWRREVTNAPGLLADVLQPLAEAGVNLRVVMGYVFPGNRKRAAIEVFPVQGKQATAAARRAGLRPSPIPCLLVEGDDRPGLGAKLGGEVADQGVNIAFVMAETVGKKFSAVFGFQSDSDRERAARAIKNAAQRRHR